MSLRHIFAIACKEAWVYLTTWTSYVLFGAFLEITAFCFYLLINDFQQRRFQYAQMRAAALLERMNLTDLVAGPLFSYIATFFIFLLPILTMRLIAEERRERTLELLMTAPIRTFEIVAGKYLAALWMMVIMLALTLIFPIALHFWGGGSEAEAIDWQTVWVGYLGMSLLGAAAVAIGLFASSVTESQVVAAIIGFNALLVLLVIGVAAPGQTEPWKSVLEYLSISNHMQGFARGVVRSQDVIYYLSIGFLGLFFTHRVLDAERWR